MRVIALVSLALALAASSMPLSARNNDVPATQDQTFGATGSGTSGVISSTGGNPRSVSKGGPTGTGTVTGSGSGKTGDKSGGGSASGPGDGTASGRSNIVSSLGGSNLAGSGTGIASQLGGAESAVGKASSATNPATHDTPLRSRASDGGAPGVGTVGKVTGEAGSVGKVAQGNGIPSDAKGAAQGAAGGAAGSLTGSGSSAQTGKASA